MGAAAYTRGTLSVLARIDAEQRPAEFALMDDLNAEPRNPGAVAPWGPIRFIAGHGGWWAECPVTGHGYWYATLRGAVRAWRVTVTGYDGRGWTAVPAQGR